MKRDFEFLINDMVFDIAKIRNRHAEAKKYDRAMRMTAPALALLAWDTENKRHVHIVEGWMEWAEYYGMKGVVVPDFAFDHKTKMVAEIDSPIWDGIGIGTFEAAPFAFAALLGTRFTLTSVDFDDFERMKRHTGPRLPSK